MTEQKRKTLEEQIADAERKEAAAREKRQTLLQKKKLQDRKDDTRRKVIIGAVVLEHMKRDEDFAGIIENLLLRAVTRKIDREFLQLDKPKEARTVDLTGEAAKAVSG